VIHSEIVACAKPTNSRELAQFLVGQKQKALAIVQVEKKQAYRACVRVYRSVNVYIPHSNGTNPVTCCRVKYNKHLCRLNDGNMVLDLCEDGLTIEVLGYL